MFPCRSGGKGNAQKDVKSSGCYTLSELKSKVNFVFGRVSYGELQHDAVNEDGCFWKTCTFEMGRAPMIKRMPLQSLSLKP